MSYDDGIAKEKSLEAALNKDSAHRLSEVMSEISEEHYCAGWLSGLEYSLWEVLEGNRKAFAAGKMTDEEIQELRDLRERSGGWWWFDHDEGELFETIEAFTRRYEAWKTTRPTR